ncbi:hypothetical protein N0A02_14460 [Paraburkholderia acidicola]|uniref:Uncharacterized protein n=2 Tax=Paraburkholderia acidicola TaxID=1912599 RepID=A0ABV1LMW8_9BURK
MKPIIRSLCKTTAGKSLSAACSRVKTHVVAGRRMDVLRVLVLSLLVVANVAWAEQWVSVVYTDNKELFLDTASVKSLAEGKLEFDLKQYSSRAYEPPGVTAPIAIAVTDYVMDCRRSLWTAKNVKYLTDDEKIAAVHPEADAWHSIEPQTDLGTVYKKIC